MKKFRGNLLVQWGTKIIAIGKNYAKHVEEMAARGGGPGHSPVAAPPAAAAGGMDGPVVFLKPTSSYIREGSSIEIPPPFKTVDYEVELAVVLGKKARDIPASTAMSYVAGYALALDMTQRLPWTRAKGYDTFTPISDFIHSNRVQDPHDLELWLKVDGQLRQKASTRDMLYNIPSIVSHVSQIMTLQEGDLILTGTPEGVGPVHAGQTITAGITGIMEMEFPVIARSLNHREMT
eukprot:jgi/Chlat1/4783/Chrsp308S04746